MIIFPALGLAVLGVFVTILLTGILAGVTAFGLLDGGFRRDVQRKVIRKFVDVPVAAFLRRDGSDEYFNRYGWQRGRSFQYLHNVADRFYPRNAEASMLASLVRRAPDSLFQLPYRQLCGQIANAVGTESYSADEKRDETPDFQPLTLALVIADFVAADRPELIDIERVSQSFAKVRALAYLDTIQIALADAVLLRARFYSVMVIIIIFLAILAPNLDTLNAYAADPSFFKRSTGALLALIIAPVLIATLALAATIVSTLTFRWIDRFASAR